VTALLVRWGQGDARALDQLVPLVHQELKRIARRHMRRERAGHTLQPTALVNEAYLRLVAGDRVTWQGRAHFLAIASRVMRHVLVDFARARRYQKRGGGRPFVDFDEGLPVSDESAPAVIALDDALEALTRIDARKSRVVELRFFAGLSVDETAAALNVSKDTVMRDWRLAKAWLAREMRSTKTPD